jgi:hypothetical protein
VHLLETHAAGLAPPAVAVQYEHALVVKLAKLVRRVGKRPQALSHTGHRSAAPRSGDGLRVRSPRCAPFLAQFARKSGPLGVI